ncbi:hypothetical protein [Fluviispira vulneris]|uniref:hypothetical protein n=1 Tax=Fluviispira vulneris TaxID=2763012 RepID=UPI001648EFFF|nr:hypothetical protein [Fluviispira vulneris]
MAEDFKKKHCTLLSGDSFSFDSIEGAQLLSPVNIYPITGSGKSSINSRNICLKGDESSVILPVIPYNTSSHTIPGVLKGEIKKLASDNIDEKSFEDGKNLLKVGSSDVEVEYIVLMPAMQPGTPPIPDLSKFKFSGKGGFKQFTPEKDNHDN